MSVVVIMGAGDAQVSIAAIGDRLLVTVAVHAVHQRRSCAGAVKMFHHQTPSPASQHIRSSTISTVIISILVGRLESRINSKSPI